jgi:hypothetical protein
MNRPLLTVCSLFAAILAVSSDHPTVHVEPTDSVGPRPLEKRTEAAVIRDYLQAWRSLGGAFEQNRADLLDPDFTGTAKEKLAATIKEQLKLGIRTRYLDSAHHLQLLFYSPEGLSIQLMDTAEYDMQVLDQKTVVTTQHVRERYVVVLTPTEVRWKVRVFQGQAE